MEPENVLTDDPTQLWAWDTQNKRFMKSGLLFSDPWQPVQLTPEQQADPRYQYDSNRHRLYRDILDEQQYYMRDWKYQAQRDKMREELEWRAVALKNAKRYNEAEQLIAQFEEAVDSGRELTPMSIWGPISANSVPERNRYIDGIEDAGRYSALGQLVKQQLNQPVWIDGGVSIRGAQSQRTRYNKDGGLYGAPRIKTVDGEDVEYKHGGVDFKAEVGTPIVSPSNGIVGDGAVTEQPNRINDRYPVGYNKDKNSAGNRFYVEIEGQNNLRDAYFHLQADNPIAINPRTGVPFTQGDSVFVGDTIGYVGITGNSDPARPHLHQEIQRFKTLPNTDRREVIEKFNPLDYMNVKYDKETRKMIYPQLKINR